MSIDNFGFPINTDTPAWKFWLARIFGTRLEGRSGDHVCVAYQWRGAVYVMSVEEHPPC